MLSQFPLDQKIFIDANIFIYHFLGIKDDCTRLLAQVENREIAAFTSVIVLAEVWHRLMIAEAIESYGLTPRKAVSYLNNHPDIVRKLSRCHEAMTSIPQMRVKIWSLTQKTFVLAQGISHQYGLLTNDALNAALMRLHRVKNVATNDGDFLRVKDVKVWRPS